MRPSVTALAAHFGRHLGPAPAAPAAPSTARAHAASGHLSEAGTPAFASTQWSELELWQFIALVQVTYAVVHLAEVLVSYGVDIGAKWALLGRRAPGQYPWDASSYCLRWNVYLVVCSLRRDMLDYLRGTAYCAVFFRCLVRPTRCCFHVIHTRLQPSCCSEAASHDMFLL